MPLPTSMQDLSTVAGNNSPQGGENPNSTDDFIRAIQAIVRKTNAKGTDIASSASVNIGNATGEFVDITGTSTITSFGTIAAGIVRTVRFTDELTLTHNSSTLILPKGKDIATASNDVAVFRSLGGGNWICVSYLAAGGIAASNIEASTYETLTGTTVEAQLHEIYDLFNSKLDASQKASIEDAIAGENDDKYTTPLAVNAAITSTVTSSEAITSRQVDQIVSFGLNNLLIRSGDNAYITAGNQSAFQTTLSGKAASGQYWLYGVDNLSQVYFEGSPNITKIGRIDGWNAWAVTDDNRLFTWGNNNHDQCGHGNTSPIVKPTELTTDVVEVYSSHSQNGYSATQGRLVFRKTDGFLYGCGYDGYGQLGLGSTASTRELTQLTAFGENPISVWNLGTTYGCLVVEASDGRVLFSGYGGYGQSGAGDTQSYSTPEDVTQGWKNGNLDYRIKHANGGFGYHSTAANASSSLHMWIDDGVDGFVKNSGYGGTGALDTGTTSNQSSPSTSAFSSKIKDFVVMGGLSTCFALLENGDLYSWGRNGEGQAGTGTTSSVLSRTLVKSGVKSILTRGFNAHTYGYRTTVFIELDDGTIEACGYNEVAGCANGDRAIVTSFSHTYLSDWAHGDNVAEIGYYATANSGFVFVAATGGRRLSAWGYNGQTGVKYGLGSYVLAPHSIKFLKHGGNSAEYAAAASVDASITSVSSAEISGQSATHTIELDSQDGGMFLFVVDGVPEDSTIAFTAIDGDGNETELPYFS